MVEESEFLACKFLGIVESQIEKGKKIKSLGDIFCNGTISKS
jgi:hypothetical protein